MRYCCEHLPFSNITHLCSKMFLTILINCIFTQISPQSMFGKRKYNRGRISGRRQQWILGGFHNILKIWPCTEHTICPCSVTVSSSFLLQFMILICKGNFPIMCIVVEHIIELPPKVIPSFLY